MSFPRKRAQPPVLLLCLSLLVPACAQALEASGVVVIANTRVRGSVDLAEYYMTRRGIPQENLITVETTSNESISREAYRSDIQQPVLYALTQLSPTTHVRCLVIMYGMPLKVTPPALFGDDEAAAQKLRNTLRPLQEHLEQIDNPVEREQVTSAIEIVRQELDELTRTNTRAALDSEIALIFCGGYPLDGWLPNPHFLGFQEHRTVLKKFNVLMVSRLDGPDPATVRRLIDDSLRTEKIGLTGQAYFDARGPRPQGRKLSGYAIYNYAIHNAAELIDKSGRMEVTLDSRAELFQRGDCPNAALYCGWYSLSKYVDAFDWKPGAIGFHIASGECATLKRADSEVWCKRMLEEGIAATLGPVYEPYIQGFTMPDIFFGKLVEGNLSLAECYLVSQPYLSWQMVLIGDPLYRPFTSAGEHKRDRQPIH
ncbi:MAG: TIGR03790 family protein [Candidatus Eisenbacteria sp.]|nr:TIGR03790 family protein [Candidatus Eisenbacteria bacterium]